MEGNLSGSRFCLRDIGSIEAKEDLLKVGGHRFRYLNKSGLLLVMSIRSEIAKPMSGHSS